MATSKVLGDDDLLGEILIRLDSPTSLVRAALVCKRWLRRASHRDFLRRFRALRPPPRLLGFFVTGDCMRSEFVPMPAPQPQPQPQPQDQNHPKFSAALRHASSLFDAFPGFSSSVWDCRNGRVLYDFSETLNGERRFGVSDPLRYPDRGVAEFPPPPPGPEHQEPLGMLLPDDEHDDASCYRVEVDRWGHRRVSVQVSVLRSGAWTVLSSAWAKLDRPPDRIPMITLLAGGKLYMVAVAGYIIWMDLAAANLSIVEFPEGVAYRYFGNLALCRGDDSVLYLLHVKGDRLSVWLRKMDDEHGAPAAEWVLRDTISVRETCGHLVEQSSSGATEIIEHVDVVGVGDNAEFVFLELNANNAVVHMHLRSRRVEKVYQRDPDNDEIILVHPLLMVGLPVFPALDQGEELHQE